jgi:SAM-dependent methyltransferase
VPPTFHDHFSAVAGRYAVYRPQYPAALFDSLAKLVPREALVWDCAAGSGQASSELARRFARVIATDASHEQLSAAPVIPNIEHRVATAEQSGLPAASVGLITVAQALHWFDLPRFYAEVRRVLAPGGVLAVWCYGINELEGAAVNRLVQEFYAVTLGPYWPPTRQLVESGYRTLPFPFGELPAPVLQMETRWTLEQMLGYFSTWSARQQFIQANGHDPLIPLAESLGRIWGDPGATRSVVWPLSMRLGRAR